MFEYGKKLLFLLLAFALLLPTGASAQTNAKELSVDEIIRRTVAKEKERDQKRISLRYTFLQRITKDEIDDDGKVQETEKSVVKSVPVGNTQYNRLIEKNGEPLSGDDLEDEKEKEREFLEELKKNKGKKNQEEEGSFEFNEEFVAKYDFALRGEQSINGRPAYVIDYKPKSGDLPEENMSDRFLNKTKGTVWIDKEDFVIAKVNTKLIEPVKVFGGIAASVKKMDFTIELKKEGDEWFPSSVTQKVAGRKLVSSFNTHVKVTFDSFEKKED